MAKAPYLLTEAGGASPTAKENGPNAGPPCRALTLPGSRPSEGSASRWLLSPGVDDLVHEAELADHRG